MEEAVWAVIGESVPVVGALLLVLYILVAVQIGLLDGLRVDRWAVFKRLEGAFGSNRK